MAKITLSTGSGPSLVASRPVHCPGTTVETSKTHGGYLLKGDSSRMTASPNRRDLALSNSQTPSHDYALPSLDSVLSQ